MDAGDLLLLKPHQKELGGFRVSRLLPAAGRQTVGPFIFFDHMGPVDFAPGEGVAVRPHPHIGLATVTYLFDGAFVHRDSLGTVQTIVPGEVNWMSAGRGIVHSERSPGAHLARGVRVHGIQTWVALPRDREQAPPSFTHLAAESLPEVALPGVRLRVLAGSAFGREAPTPVASPTLYCALEMAPGAALDIPAEHEERALYPVDAGLEIDGRPVPAGHMAVLPAGVEVRVLAPAGGRVMLLGGAPLDGPRFIWWNFVASERAAIEAARARWRDRGFPPVPGDAEYSPLPD